MRIFEVKSKTDQKTFLNVARIVYKNNTTWVCPPDKDINAIFDVQKNVFFRHGSACRWILKDDNNKLLGRIASFINEDKLNTEEQPTGGIGFFECINNFYIIWFVFVQ